LADFIIKIRTCSVLDDKNGWFYRPRWNTLAWHTTDFKIILSDKIGQLYQSSSIVLMWPLDKCVACIVTCVRVGCGVVSVFEAAWSDSEGPWSAHQQRRSKPGSNPQCHLRATAGVTQAFWSRLQEGRSIL